MQAGGQAQSPRPVSHLAMRSGCTEYLLGVPAAAVAGLAALRPPLSVIREDGVLGDDPDDDPDTAGVDPSPCFGGVGWLGSRHR